MGYANAAAVILMIGIGILYLAVTHSMVKEVLNPFLLAVVPQGRIGYIIFFSLLAPLALYRGPMNLFGLGSGIAALVIGLNTLSPLAVMAAFLAAERIQGCGDPTNTQNVWTANFCEVDVNGITKKLLPYLWIVAVIGVVIGALLLGVINMGMSIMGITDSWQYVVKGGVLLVAVIFDVVSSRKNGK